MSFIEKSKQNISRILIFENTDDLLNLTALIAKSSCVISPSTGTTHLACNQRIPTIALYPEYDVRRWATHNKRYVFLNKPLVEISQSEGYQAINQTLDTLKIMLNNNEIHPFVF